MGSFQVAMLVYRSEKRCRKSLMHISIMSCQDRQWSEYFFNSSGDAPNSLLGFFENEMYQCISNLEVFLSNLVLVQIPETPSLSGKIESRKIKYLLNTFSHTFQMIPTVLATTKTTRNKTSKKTVPKRCLLSGKAPFPKSTVMDMAVVFGLQQVCQHRCKNPFGEDLLPLFVW